MKTKLIFPNSVLCQILLALFSACSLSPSTPAPTTTAGNLAPNLSFEEGANGVVSEWEGNIDPTIFTWSDDVAYGGTRSVCIGDVPADASVDWITSEFISVTPGTTYTLSAYVKGDLDREVYIMVFPIDADGNYMEGSAADVSFNNTDWTYAEIGLTIPPEAVSVELDLGANNNSDTATTGTVCYDEVSFQ